MAYEKAARSNMIIDRGSFFQKVLRIKDPLGDPFDLTDYYAEMDIRVTPYSDETILQLSSITGNIVLGDTTGIMLLLINTTITEGITTPVATYDIKLKAPNGKVDYILWGNLTINRTVTR